MEIQDIWFAFQKAKACAKNRGYNRKIKSFSAIWEKRKPEERENIRKMHRFLLTTWQNIDIDKYFSCGFELWKNFTYTKWFDPKIIELYVLKERNDRIKDDEIKTSLVNSAKFIKNYIKDNDIKDFRVYSRKRDNHELLCINHFIQNKISKWMLAFLIINKYCIIEPEDWFKINDIKSNLLNFKFEFKENKNFIDKFKLIVL